MNYIRLSIKKLQSESRDLAARVEETFHPDAVIYIARGGYLIGKEIADHFGVPCAGIHAEREGNSAKDSLAPILRRFPHWLTKLLREMELRSGVHKVKTERHIYWDEEDRKHLEGKSLRNVLLVDDSVDTGYSMAQVKEKLLEDFGPAVIIKTAALNLWAKSIEVCPTDYYNYRDTILVTPMSKDSDEYPAFEEMYRRRNERP